MKYIYTATFVSNEDGTKYYCLEAFAETNEMIRTGGGQHFT